MVLMVVGRRQINMPEIKEQEKSPEKISKWNGGKQFTTYRVKKWFIRMIKEVSENSTKR